IADLVANPADPASMTMSDELLDEIVNDVENSRLPSEPSDAAEAPEQPNYDVTTAMGPDFDYTKLGDNIAQVMEGSPSFSGNSVDESSVPFETGDSSLQEAEQHEDADEDANANDSMFNDQDPVVSSADDLNDIRPTGDSGEMVYRRSDNSVLFSLSDLEEKETDPHQEATAKALAAITADSGLIDIRSFSKKKKQDQSKDLFASLSGESQSDSVSVDPDLTLSTSTSAIPVIQTKKRTGLYVTAGILGALALAAITAFVVLDYFVPKSTQTARLLANTQASKTPPAKTATKVKRADTKTAPSKKPVTPKNAAAKKAESVAAIPPKPATTDEKTKTNSGTTETKPNAKKEKVAEPAPKRTLTTAERLARKRAFLKLKEQRKKARAAKAAAKPPKPVAKAPPKKKAKTSRLDPNALLNQMQRPKETKKKKESVSSDPNLPMSLTALQIKRVVRRAAGKIRKCVTNAGMSNVQVTTAFTIKPNGDVSDTRVRKPVASSAAAGCVKSAIAGLRFPRFRGPAKPINYPFFIK
ncbi:MAG TPA: AgmX/PglI C-terminal domain-containing protein, partial [Myxococcales bacterium]|nr:AgmX/PglI C-terminal domain-containing protein [Myxococcales bacterium]